MAFKMFNKVNFRRFLLILIIILVIVLIQLIKNRRNVINYFTSSKNLSQKTAQNITPTNRVANYYTGIIYTSGLLEDEKKNLNLDSKYQLEKGRVSEGNWPDKIAGYFLETKDEDLGKYLGRCVKIYGDVKEGWGNLLKDNYEYKGVWTYYRSAIVIARIDETDMTNCINNFDVREEDPEKLEEMKNEYKKLTGVLKFTDNRPAPDIPYDYVLTLSNPFYDSLNASGNYITKELNVLGSTDGVEISLLENAGKKVEVEGYMGWGLAESRHFTIYSIKPL